MATAFEAGSILIAIRTASAQAIQGLARVKAGLKSLGVSAIGVSKIVNAAGRRMQRTFASLGRMVKRFALVAKIALIAAGVAAGKMAVDFEASLSKIVGLVGVSRKQVQAWREDLLTLGAEVGKGPRELADALFFLTSAGLRGQDAIDALRSSAQAATAGLGETKSVADAITSAMAAYRDANLSAADATGILVAIVREGKKEAGDFAPAIGRVIPIASEMGISFDQVGAALASMTLTGLNADEAVTALRTTLSVLQKPSGDAEEALKGMGIAAEDLRKQLKEEGLLATLQRLKEATADNEEGLSRVFPEMRAITGVLTLVGKNADVVRQKFQALATAGAGDLAKAFEEATSTMKFRFLKQFARVEAGLIRLGNDVIGPIVLPIFEKLVDLFEDAAKKGAAFAIVLRESIEEVKQSLEARGIGDVIADLADRIFLSLAKIAAKMIPLAADMGATFTKAFFKSSAAIAKGSLQEILVAFLNQIGVWTGKVAVFLRVPFDFIGKLIDQVMNRADIFLTWLMLQINVGVVKALEALPDLLVPDEVIDKFQEFVEIGEKSLRRAKDGARDFSGLWTEAVEQAEARAKDIEGQALADLTAFLAKMDAARESTDAERARVIEEQILQLTDKWRDAMGELGPEITALFAEVGEGLGINVDKFRERLEDLLRVAKDEVPLISPGGAPGTPTDTGTKEAARSTGQIIAAAVREGLEAQQAVIADTLAGAVARGVINGIRRGAKAIEILADIGRQLFEKALTDAIESFKVAMSKAIAELAGESKGLINGILNAAIALVGFLLSQLDKGSDSSRRFGRVGPEVDSSQLVRGVISGPTNVAIAEVGENLKRALSGVEERLDVIIGFLFEARDGFAFRGAALAPAAGNAATP